MHTGSMLRMSWFVDNYIKAKLTGGGVKFRVLDVGSYDVNGCMRSLFDGTDIEYVGLDIEAGPNVDIVMNDAYNWDNVPNESFDFVISANAFEHIEYPWLTIKLIYDKLKPGGFACIHAPLNIGEHRYPLDCYRYFSDGFRALGKWAGFQVINVTVGGVPSLSASKEWDGFNDTLMIVLKSDKPVNPDDYPVLAYERRFDFFSEDASALLHFKIWLRYFMPSTYWTLRKIKLFLRNLIL